MCSSFIAIKILKNVVLIYFQLILSIRIIEFYLILFVFYFYRLVFFFSETNSHLSTVDRIDNCNNDVSDVFLLLKCVVFSEIGDEISKSTVLESINDRLKQVINHTFISANNSLPSR